MKKIIKPITALCGLAFMAILIMSARAKNQPETKKVIPKIQVAILLDVSSSMDGLIEQAKAQLWNMVNVLGKAKCTNGVPNIEIALYEYGRSTNNEKNGFIKQHNGFITNLDSLSENLFTLTTNGGNEYCGQVIHTSLNELQWDAAPENYKVIFIAGNEDFLQGSIKYTEACTIAKQKGVIVNTIYCGDKQQGIREHWNLGGECGDGSYTNINSNAAREEIPTPFDSIMYVLNSKLNSTYLSYGFRGADMAFKQEKMDVANTSMSYSVGIKRISAKANKAAYRNDEWDLVDAFAKDSMAVKNIASANLPENLRNKSKEELVQLVKQKNAERGIVQSEIGQLNTKREAYLAEERKRRAAITNEPTLESEVEKIIKLQGKRYNIRFE